MGLRLVQSLVVSAASRVVGVRLPKTARLGEPARHARDGRAGRATARQQARRVEGRRLAPGSERAGAARRCPPVASARLAELMQRVERPLRSARPSCISRRSPATSCARSPTSSTCRLATTLPKKPPLRPAPRGRRSAVWAASAASSRMPLEPPVDAVVACCSMLSFFLLKKPASLLCRTPPAQQQRERAPGRRLLCRRRHAQAPRRGRRHRRSQPPARRQRTRRAPGARLALCRASHKRPRHQSTGRDFRCHIHAAQNTRGIFAVTQRTFTSPGPWPLSRL